jgi:hypothetical protein
LHDDFQQDFQNDTAIIEGTGDWWGPVQKEAAPICRQRASFASNVKDRQHLLKEGLDLEKLKAHMKMPVSNPTEKANAQ